MKNRALLYTDDTDNLMTLARCLVKRDWEILSAGQTGKLLTDAGIAYTAVSVFDDSPRTFGDYGATLQSLVASGRQNEYGYSDETDTIRLVCINLEPASHAHKNYKASDSVADKIDMRALSFVQAACKNYKNVLVLTDSADYEEAIVKIETQSVSEAFRLYLAAKAFNMVSACTAAAGNAILRQTGDKSYPRYFMLPYKKSEELINKEQSHRSACLYTLLHGGALDSLRKNQGGELLYSLYVNIDAVWESLSNFSALLKKPPTVIERGDNGNETEMRFTPAAESVFTCSSKHGIPISAALGSNSAESFQKMSGCRKAFFDSAVAGFSAVVDEHAAHELLKSNLAAVVAPDFTAGAKALLAERKDIRLITMSTPATISYTIRSLNGGLIVEEDKLTLFDSWNVVTKARPTQLQADEAAFGQLVMLGAKHDAAAVIGNMTTIGMCCAALAPADACFAALNRAANNMRAELINGARSAEILVSGSALPFDGGFDRFVKSGIRLLVQPGGTDTDAESIAFCDEHDIAMVFTGAEIDR